MKFINNLAYEASAGSGKTFMLVVRYISLLFLGAKPSKILALTFTNKAAHEMSERIALTLEELESRDELDVIIELTSLSKDEILQNSKRILDEFLNADVKIMTIDSFFTSILRKFSLYASLMPDFSTFATQHEIKLLDYFLKSVRKNRAEDTLINLSTQSKRRLEDIFGILDDFYTKFIELKDIEFIQQDLKEFEDKIFDSLLSLKKIVDNCEGASATVQKAVAVSSIDDLLKKTWLERDTLEYRTFSKCYTPQMDIYLQEIKDNLKLYFLAKEQNFLFALKRLVSIYIESKKKLYMDDGELSFSDVTFLVYEILNLIDDSEFLYFRLDSKIEHILLDEFQDTSILQYEILKPIISEITSGSGIFENGSFFFVGDTKQSIYRFRGGVSALFGEVAKEHHTHIEPLLVNYRSKKIVVDFVNELFRDKIPLYQDQLPKEDVECGYVEVIESSELLSDVVKEVRVLLDNGADINNIAVLCATNSDGEEIKLALESEGLEVLTETTSKLINQNSIKAILEYLKYQYFQKDIYLYNFFALIQKEPMKIKKVNLSSTPLTKVVKDMVDEFGLYVDNLVGENENIIKFFDILRGYSDIESLLFEYERIDADAVASVLNGVRVLTVHKSKGLEYKHLIVMDRLKKAPSSRGMIIYDYDGIKLQNIYLRLSKREYVDSNYKEVLNRERELVLQDRLNALYVAFTRAKNNLIVIKKDKDSEFDILELKPLKIGALVCDDNLSKSDEVFAKFVYKPLSYGIQTNILESKKENIDDLKAINFGLALHYMLEMLGDFSVSCIDEAKNMMLNRYGDVLDDKDISDIVQRVEKLLKNSEFLSLSQGEVFKEKALKYKNTLKYIDLLIKKDDSKWVVIDYKSSYLYAQEHKNQVKFYIEAIKKITGDEVEGYLCYLLKDEISIIKT